jgi:hypothetical protein
MAEQEPVELLLTYPELGERLGISADGARVRAKRAGWPVLAGNDGRAKVRVLVADLPEHVPDKPEREPDSLAEIRRTFAERVAELKTELHEVRQQAEQWRTAAEQARVEAEHERGMREAEVAGERGKLDLMREQLEREVTRADRLEAELRRPWWRKLLG